jgi:hypothetical protein
MKSDSGRSRDAVAADTDLPGPTLSYASHELDKGLPPRIDAAALCLGAVQLLIAAFFTLQNIRASNGHHELRDPTWGKWLAWWATGGAWMLWAWAVGSLVALIGALRKPGQRARWYLVYMVIWLAGAVACLVGLAVIDSFDDVQERWVPNVFGFGTWDWHSVVVESADYIHLPAMLTITNPLIVLFVVRLLRSRWQQMS